jgi:hypothetical protein
LLFSTGKLGQKSARFPLVGFESREAAVYIELGGVLQDGIREELKRFACSGSFEKPSVNKASSDWKNF